MSDKTHAPMPTCDCLPCSHVERDRLRNLLNNRPAVNAGLESAYVKWSGQVYESDMLAHAGIRPN